MIERTDRGGAYWYFRYWRDEVQPDGSVKTVRKFQRLGASRGENKLTKKQAEIERDRILGNLNKATVEEKIVEEGLILLGAMAEKYIHSYVDATATGRSLLSISTRIKYHNQAEGCDFKGLGPHSFRRANITWRQEVGASAIEAAKIAGHGSVRMTEH